MGILANGFLYRSCGQKIYGATAWQNTYPQAHHGNYVQPGWIRNITAGEAITSGLTALPQGERHPRAWMMPQKAGALASRNALTGSGAVTNANAWSVKLATADVTGVGDMEGIGGLIVSLIAAITGSGEVSSANVQAFLSAVANLTGSGDIDGTATGLGALLASLVGDGDIDLTPTAVGELDADLVVTGTGLTTANVGAAVWARVIEAGFTAEQVLRILAAVNAGSASGLESGSPSFTGIDGATERVAGTYSGGTRTIDTLDGA